MIVGMPRRMAQPQGPVAIDRGNPITQGLVLATNLGVDGIDAVSGVPHVFSGATKVSVGPAGVSRAFGGQAAGGTTDRVTTYLTNQSSKRTWLIVAAVNSPGTGTSLGRFFSRNGVTEDGAWTDNTATAIRFSRGYSVTSGQWAYSLPPARTPFCFAVSHDSSSTSNQATAALNGSVIAPFITQAAAGTADSASGALGFGNTSALNRGLDGWISLGLVWDRLLSASELVQVTANPWQIFSPTPRLPLAFQTSISITRPNSDITVAGWTSTGANYFGPLADSTDATFDTSPDVTAPTPLVVGLDSSLAAGTYDITVRALRTGTTGRVRVLLLDGSGATVGTSSFQALTGSFGDYVLSVTTTGTATRAQIEVTA